MGVATDSAGSKSRWQGTVSAITPFWPFLSSHCVKDIDVQRINMSYAEIRDLKVWTQWLPCWQELDPSISDEIQPLDALAFKFASLTSMDAERTLPASITYLVPSAGPLRMVLLQLHVQKRTSSRRQIMVRGLLWRILRCLR